MVSKDQTIGGAIFIVCLIVAIFYVVTLFYPAWLNTAFGANLDLASVQFWIIAIPVFVAFVAIMAIGAWIGWTMATTPPPKPIEEITSEMEEPKPKQEPSKPAPEPTEMPTETPAEPTEEPKPEEEKKPERRRRTEKQ